jgi:CheY-like chemotaxis protein
MAREVVPPAWAELDDEIASRERVKTVYLADRDPAYRTSLAQALRGCGAQVLELASGSELYARTTEEEPDLVVMETDLEQVDGFQVFVRLQRERPEKPYPLVLLSRFYHPGVASVCKHHGALDYLSKDLPLEQVVARIRGLLAELDAFPAFDLPAALAWLRAGGKSGRLDLLAHGERGHVILYKGTVLEACWNFFDGDEALRVLKEVPLAARFSFLEWPGQSVSEEPRSSLRWEQEPMQRSRAS